MRLSNLRFPLDVHVIYGAHMGAPLVLDNDHDMALQDDSHALYDVIGLCGCRPTDTSSDVA